MSKVICVGGSQALAVWWPCSSADPGEEQEPAEVREILSSSRTSRSAPYRQPARRALVALLLLLAAVFGFAFTAV